jgi:hypothetical protein
MAFIARDRDRRSNFQVVQRPRATAVEHVSGLPEMLFTGVTAVVFLVLMAAVAAAAILYSRGA